MNESIQAAAGDDLEIPSTGGKPFSLAACRGRTLVIYFYPKDATPGCTTEAQEFRDLHESFAAAGATVVGVSRDSLASHEKFKARQELPFDLVADVDERLCARFSVIKEKKLYGRPVRGVERSTFVIDDAGKLAKEWRGVKAPGHAQQVLDFVKALRPHG
jgi:thioredoxin-dependent peroxiredoxin